MGRGEGRNQPRQRPLPPWRDQTASRLPLWAVLGLAALAALFLISLQIALDIVGWISI